MASRREAVAGARSRQGLRLWRLLALVLAAVALGAFLRGADGSGANRGGPHVARIDIEGFISADRRRLASLRAVARDDGAQALILFIDSPGGTVVGGESLYDEIRRVGADKPVVAVLETTATSAAYMAAIAADRVVAHSGTMTGSIGAVLRAAEASELLEQLGIEVNTLTTGPFKAVPDPAAPLEEEGREALQAVLDDIHAFFVDLVAERRPLDREAVLGLADGRVYSGRMAVGNGLVDALGGEKAARDWLLETHGVSIDLPLVDRGPQRPRRWMRRLFADALGLLPESIATDGLLAIWNPRPSF